MKFEKMTKAQIIEKIESIPADMLNSAVTAIRYSNPLNVISTNRVNVYIRSNRVIKIEFQSRATKQNMIAVYTEILDRIAVYYGIEEVHNIEAEYTPVWWEDDTAPAEEQTTNTTDTEEEEEEQTMNTNTKKYSFEIRQIDALNYGEDEGWIWNTSYNMGEMVTKAKDERKAFTAWMKRHLGITFKPNRTLIEYDGDVYTIIDRKTKEPLFAAIPNC